MVSFTGCQAQQFERIEPIESRIITTTVKAVHSGGGGSTLLTLQGNFTYRVDKELPQDKQYMVILQLSQPVQRKKANDATLLDYRITEEQARVEIIEMLKEFNDANK